MSKRNRGEMSSYPYSSLNGGKWLKKALDPADTDVDVVGFPDTETVPRVVLNYQMQQDIPIPDFGTYSSNSVSAYDAELFLFHNPIIFGISASFPQSTKDIAGNLIHLNFNDGSISIPSGSCPRTVSVYLNDQIEGNNVREKIANLKSYCQRYRMIYGGVQAIPACSAMFDSGTIEATQQVFSPETSNATGLQTNTLASDNNVYRLQIFNSNDFPSSGVAIQNPTSLYCRYKEGMYMPYKIRNPLVHRFISSEEKTLVKCPYFVTSEAQWISPNSIGALKYNAENHSFTPLDADRYPTYVQAAPTFAGATKLCLKCYTKTGIPFWFVYQFYSPGTPPQDWDGFAAIQLPETVPAYPSATELESGSNYKLWIFPGSLENGHSTGQWWNNTEDCMNLISTDSTLGSVFFKSVGLQASVRLIFRMGVEFMITAGGVYSPFKHKAPKFDQAAINSYIRAIHGMRDAFYGDAAEAGHAEYTAQVLDIANGGNQGAGWYGRVSI